MASPSSTHERTPRLSTGGSDIGETRRKIVAIAREQANALAIVPG
jgi:hypothetical protein